MAAEALHGWHAAQARRLSDLSKPTRFAHLARLPTAAHHHAADQVSIAPRPSAPPHRSFSDPRAQPPRWPSQQPPLQGRLRPPRRSAVDAESRSGSEQGLTPDASPRDPSPKPPASLAARRASLNKELPAPNGNLRALNPALLGMGAAAAAAAMGASEAPGGKLYQRRISHTRAAAPTAPRGNWGRTGHSVWGRRRR
eukprot:Hpha_TRINITY_DN14174_c0_g1::TRINITY_DN14174_c0_g1_i1::g.10660::m.10660